MILAQTVGVGEILIVLAYMLVVGYLGWLGYKGTKTDTDYLVAGRKVHPFVMALSYGATFISTSAIVGFGGVAGLFGMSLLWLTFLNIFVGIFIAFVFLGPPTRAMGHHLDAHTFPELLGRRYQSKFIQVFAGIVIFLFMPLYAAAVLIGGCEFIAARFMISYEVALFIFSVIIAAYVVMGGLKGVMYTDALQGSIMFLGMLALLIFTYIKVGGVTAGHQYLSNLSDLVPAPLQAIGHRGWTQMPPAGWGDKVYNLWWIVISAITLGVGIGVLAQPQLAVRFMTVKSKRELNRAVLVGGVFIMIMTGVAFTVGALSNAYFAQHGDPIAGRVIKPLETPGHAVIQLVSQNDAGQWQDVEGKKLPVVLDDSLTQDGQIVAVDGKDVPVVYGRTISMMVVGGPQNSGRIIPDFITKALPGWFGLLFLLTLLAAAMSTLSSQFHAVGTSIGRDVFEQVTGPSKRGVLITRLGVVLGIFVAVIISYFARGQMAIIARFTAIFFGLCAAAFLPTFVGGLFFRGVTRAGAITSMTAGFVITAFWLLFIKDKEAKTLGLCQAIFDKSSLLLDKPNWPEVDPLVVALPISLAVLIIVSLFTRPPANDHLDRCFKK